MDFDYSSHFLHSLARSHDPARPIQIEIHPGIHCDLYRCPHCYGHKQHPLKGSLFSVDDLARALDDVAHLDPTIILAGVVTEPLTRSDAPALIRAVRQRNLRLGLYTKGNRLGPEVIEELLPGSSECFVTFSVDAVDSKTYSTIHDIPPNRRDSYAHRRGEDYFDAVVENIRKLREARDQVGSPVQVRVALLMFESTANEATVDAAVEIFTPIADIVRFSFPQNRNDGQRPGTLPSDRAGLLKSLAEKYQGHPQVRILQGTAEPTRSSSFRLCHIQRFQVVIDKSGNLFPCPQVAVSPYSHLSFGNLRDAPFKELLRSDVRLSKFRLDVDKDMKCRICDRKDEAANIVLDRLNDIYKH